MRVVAGGGGQITTAELELRVNAHPIRMIPHQKRPLMGRDMTFDAEISRCSENMSPVGSLAWPQHNLA